MSVHTSHNLIHSHGLADDCERCVEIGRDPLGTLDKGNLHDLIERTLGHRFGDDDTIRRMQPRSEAEAMAMARVMTMLEQTGGLFAAAPGEVADYLDDRWRVKVEVAS